MKQEVREMKNINDEKLLRGLFRKRNNKIITNFQ